MGARPPEGSVVACQGHGNEADGYGAGFGCGVGVRSVSLVLWAKDKGRVEGVVRFFAMTAVWCEEQRRGKCFRWWCSWWWW